MPRWRSRSERFRVPKTSSDETGLVNDTVPPSTKSKNKWALNIFAEWQSLREVKVPALDCGGVAELLVVQIREEQDESIALKDVVFQKGSFNNSTINVK